MEDLGKLCKTVTSGEDGHTEFKERPSELAREMMAFANGEGDSVRGAEGTLGVEHQAVARRHDACSWR